MIASGSSFAYTGENVDVVEASRRLGVRYLLQGSVRRSGQRLRITAQLIDAGTRAHLWADRLDGDLADVFAFQDAVAARVVGSIGPRLLQAEIDRIRRKPTGSFDACYALPYAVAARCYLQRHTNNWMRNRTQEVAEATRLARRAAELGPDDAIALSLAGNALIHVALDIEAGAAIIERAIEHSPTLAIAWYTSSWGQIYLGHYDEGIRRAQEAMRLSPIDPSTYVMENAIAVCRLMQGDFTDAISWASKSSRRNPRWRPSMRVLSAALALGGEIEKARDIMAQVRRDDPALRLGDVRRLAPYRRREDFETYVRGLQLAGLTD